MTVTANYDNSTNKNVTASATFTGYDMSTAGDQTVTVSYTENKVTKTATYDITVSALTSIALSGEYPTVFTEGDAFSHEGMTVTANYDNSTSADVTAKAEFSGYDMNTVGVQTVTVSYGTRSATYDITVNALPTYTVTFADDSSTETQASYGAGVTLPSRSNIGGYTFAGWSASIVAAETTTAPTIITESYTPTANITLYPVYKRTEAGDVQNKTASVNIASYASANSWSNSAQYGTVTLDANVTATANGGSNTGKYYTSGGGSWRIYKSENAYLTISVPNGELTSATITFSNSTLSYNNNNITSGTAVSLSGTSASFYAGGTTYITAISVDYTVGSSTTYYVSSPAAVTLNDGEPITALNAYTGKQCYVSYTRAFTEGKTSTVCLPFAFPVASASGTFYTFTGISQDGSGEYVATMTASVNPTLTANTPYLYMPDETGSVNFSGTYDIPASLTAGTTTSGDWKFTATYDSIKWEVAPTGIYGFSAQDVDDIYQGQFVKVGNYVLITPMRCYLKYKDGKENYARSMNRAAEQLPDVIKVRLVSAEGDVTAIGSLSTKTGEVSFDKEGWYTLDGRRIEGKPSTKGIYVNNGKKVIIK